MGKALFAAKRSDLFRFYPEELVLVTDPADPLYDARVELLVDEALVRNIMCNGVIEPVVVTKRGEGPVVVDGRQRVRCTAEANRRLAAEGKVRIYVPCVVRHGTEKDLFGVTVSANENRQDDTPLARAEKASRLLAMGADEEEVAVHFGVPRQRVKNWLTLLSASAPVRKAVESGQLSVSAASKLAGLPADAQKAALASPEKLTARAAQRKVAKAKGRSVAPKLRTRKEIAERAQTAHLDPQYKAALLWVLREDVTA